MKFELVDVTLDDGTLARGLRETAAGPATPLVIDFGSAKLRHRLKNGADSEAVVKAMGLKASARRGQLIYDFTAGLGTDAFLLARAGFRVVAFERDPAVFQLLIDALMRYRRSPEMPIVDLEFREGDAARLDFDLRAYAVVIDPMFEEAATAVKSLPKKEMAMLRRMLVPSSEPEITALFHRARKSADARVVVKRPNGAPDLASTDESGRRLTPVHRLEGKSARFDIYSCR